MRRAIPLRRSIHGAALACAVLLPSGALPQEEAAKFTLPEARALAAHALAKGRPAFALQLTDGLLSANSRSSYAHFVQATAYAHMGRATDGRKSAAKAYRYTDVPLQKFEAAELAARLSLADDRPTLTQLWLRRAVQNAPSDQIEQQLGKDYARVRQQNPLGFSVLAGVQPSSNVNNGADTSQQIIQGLPFTGQLSGAAQALAGTIGMVDAHVGYRLRGTKTARTDIAARLYVRRVKLESGASVLAPGLRDRDLGSSYAELKLSRRMMLDDTGDSVDLSAATGQYWTGGSTNYRFARLTAGRDWTVSRQTTLTLDGSVEQRLSARSDLFDSRILGLAVSVQRQLGWGDGISVSLKLSDTDSDFANSRGRAAALRIGYRFADRIGPALVSTGLVFGRSDHPDYFAVFSVPGGKQDNSAYADLNLFLPDADYAGFAPTIKLRAGRTRSNVSRFDTTEMSVSVGIRSKF